MRETFHGSADLNIAVQNFSQARGNMTADRFRQVETLLKEKLEIYENALAADDRNLSNRINDYMDLHRNLFMGYFRRGQYDEADELINRGKTALENNFHADDQTIAIFLNFFASLYKENKLLNRAIPFYILMIDQLKNHPNKFKYRIAEAQQNVGNMYFFTEQYDKAELNFQLVLDYCEKTNNQNPELCCNAMNNMGALKSSILASEEAIILFKSALALAEKTLNSKNKIIADSLLNIGHYYSSVANFADALGYYERALKIFESNSSLNDRSILKLYFALGRLYSFQEDNEKAFYYTRKAMKGTEKAFGVDDEIVRQLFI